MLTGGEARRKVGGGRRGFRREDGVHSPLLYGAACLFLQGSLRDMPLPCCCVEWCFPLAPLLPWDVSPHTLSSPEPGREDVISICIPIQASYTGSYHLPTKRSGVATGRKGCCGPETGHVKHLGTLPGLSEGTFVRSILCTQAKKMWACVRAEGGFPGDVGLLLPRHWAAAQRCFGCTL